MYEKKTFTDEALERIRSGKHQESHQKRRKLSRTVLIVDAVIVLLIFLFVYRDNKSPDFYTTSLEYKNCQIRYSINRDNTYKDYHFSLQVEGLQDINVFKTKKSFATVKLFYKGNEVTSFDLGPGKTRTAISKNEFKNYIYTMDKDILAKFIPHKKKRKKRHLIELENSLTIMSQLIINTPDRVSTSLKFNFEVPK